MTHYPSSFFINKINDRIHNPQSAKSIFYRMVIEKHINYIEQQYGGRLYDLNDYNNKVSEIYRIEDV